MSPIFVVPVIVAILLALPALRRRSLGAFLAALFFSAFGIVLPLVVFFLSIFLTPDWKGAALHGWVDCFHFGKLALTPLVIWATVAFFVVEIYGIEDRTQPRIVLGYFSGAVVSCVCLIFGLFCVPWHGPDSKAYLLWMSAPLYVAFWYSLRAAWLMSKARIKPKMYLATLGGSSPLWIGSVLWSHAIYQGLPDQMPECFVVTAASRGHRRLVGPFFEITRGGQGKTANRQLLTFWQFEEILRGHFPRFHRGLRRIYNFTGPIVARCISRAWVADAVYLALKPVEKAAGLFVRLEWNFFKNTRQAGPAETANAGGTQ